MPDSEKPTPQTTSSENLSVLLIMEDRLLGDDLALTLEEIGCSVILSRNGAATLQAMPSSPDFVVIDAAGAEQVDALDLGERLGRLLGSPIVYLVDDEEQASRVDERAAGASLVKWPFPAFALEAALHRALAAAEKGSSANTSA